MIGQRYEGHIKKFSPAAGQGWQERFFVLEDGKLHYYKGKDARAMFDELDEDDSGFLEMAELAILTRMMGKKLNKKALEKAMAQMDSSGDGKVSFPEFNVWWQKHGGSAISKGAPAGTIDLRKCKWVRTMSKRESEAYSGDRSEVERMVIELHTPKRPMTLMPTKETTDLWFQLLLLVVLLRIVALLVVPQDLHSRHPFCYAL